MDEDRQNAQTIDDRPWGHRWGFADTRFVLNDDGSVTLTGGRYDLSGYRMYDFLPYIEKALGVRLDLTDRKEEVRNKPVRAPNRNEAFCQSVERAFPSSQYTTDDRERLIHSHGQTSADEVFRVIYDRIQRVADMVFHCESQEDAHKIIHLAKEHDVCLVPFGGGTSVSCALKLPESEKRMIVCVDMKRMNKIEWIDKENLRAGVQAGITGLQLERELEKAGFTSGHEPDSLELSTVGGWIASNASGMKKNRYGNIENLVEDITMITPEGILEQAE
ncbi:MAG: FAD-dependent oxidoreductase, partial [Acidobacteria bacterium]|nr:FAD-dependent oxidoreductase [Acidobacteriota bacterium]